MLSINCLNGKVGNLKGQGLSISGTLHLFSLELTMSLLENFAAALNALIGLFGHTSFVINFLSDQTWVKFEQEF